MGWKDLPYWLRGVVIALPVIVLLLFVFKFLILLIGFIPGYVALTFFGQVLQNIFPGLFSSGDNWFYYLWGVIVSLIIGAIIGLIVGKRKNRKR